MPEKYPHRQTFLNYFLFFILISQEVQKIYESFASENSVY